MRAEKYAATAVLLLGLVVAGCSAPCSNNQAEPTAARPFNGITYYDPVQRATLHSAEEQFVADCMQERGFPYHPQGQAAGSHVLDANPYALLTPTQAATDGFGIISSSLNVTTPTDSNKGEENNAAWKSALLGTESHRIYVRLPAGQEFFYNTDACVRQARVKLYGADYDRLYNTFQVLTDQVVEKVQADPRYEQAQRNWQACMRDAGVPARTLAEPPATIRRQLGQVGSDQAKLHEVIGHELTLAETDAECQRRSELFGTVSTVQADAEQAVLGADKTSLDTLRTLREQALRRATHQ